MQRFVHRAGVGIVGWRQSGTADVAATLAPRDNHRRIVTRGRHGRVVVGYAVAGTITGTIGTAVASGFTGTVNANRTIAGALGTATASGFRGVVNANRTISGALGTATASGFQGTVTNGNSTTISGSLGTAVATGFAGGVAWNRYIAGLLGVATASGFSGSVINGVAPPPTESFGGSGGSSRTEWRIRNRRELRDIFEKTFSPTADIPDVEVLLERILPPAPEPEQVQRVLQALQTTTKLPQHDEVLSTLRTRLEQHLADAEAEEEQIVTHLLLS